MSHVERVFERFHHEFTEPRHATVRVAEPLGDEPERHDARRRHCLRARLPMQVDLQGQLLVLRERTYIAAFEEPLVKLEDLPPWPHGIQLLVGGSELGHDVADDCFLSSVNLSLSFLRAQASSAASSSLSVAFPESTYCTIATIQIKIRQEARQSNCIT